MLNEDQARGILIEKGFIVFRDFKQLGDFANFCGMVGAGGRTFPEVKDLYIMWLIDYIGRRDYANSK